MFTGTHHWFIQNFNIFCGYTSFFSSSEYTHTQPLQMVLPPRDALRVLLNRLYTAQWKVNSTSKLIHLTCNHSGRFKQDGLYEHAAVFCLYVKSQLLSVVTLTPVLTVYKKAVSWCAHKRWRCVPPTPHLTLHTSDFIKFQLAPRTSVDGVWSTFLSSGKIPSSTACQRLDDKASLKLQFHAVSHFAVTRRWQRQLQLRVSHP